MIWKYMVNKGCWHFFQQAYDFCIHALMDCQNAINEVMIVTFDISIEMAEVSTF